MNPIETILAQINAGLPPDKRLTPAELAALAAQFQTSFSPGAPPEPPPPTTPASLWERLQAFWQVIKAKLAAWLTGLPDRYHQFLQALQAKLQQMKTSPTVEVLVVGALLVLAVIVAALFAKSLGMIFTVLVALGLVSLLRFFERVTRPI